MKPDDLPIDYIKRTAAYYQALGYGAPYQWANYDDVPFAALSKPLKECTIAIVTTAAPYQPDKGDQGPGAPYNADAKFYQVYAMKCSTMPDLRISHVGIDRTHTTAEDMGSYFPLAALTNAYKAGKIGKMADQFFGLPTNRSKRTTSDVDAQDLLSRCKAADVDAALLVPNCPVCHQSTSIAARILEEAGIATVVMGCAKDIVENVGVPRFLFSDFPLGNSAGLPNDPDSQQATLNMALDLLEQAKASRTTTQSPLKWNGVPDWKDDYSNAAKLSSEEIAQRRAAFDIAKNTAKKLREKVEG